MELAVVIGQVVSTVKSAGMNKERLLLVDFVDAEGKSHGRPQVAADRIGAGDGGIAFHQTFRLGIPPSVGSISSSGTCLYAHIAESMLVGKAQRALGGRPAEHR